MNTLYADGISDISIINNVIRLELFRLEPDRTTGDPAGAVKQVRELTLALPLEGLLSSLDLLDRVRQDLRRRAPPTPTAAPAEPASPVTALPADRMRPIPAPPPAGPSRSPNFS